MTDGQVLLETPKKQQGAESSGGVGGITNVEDGPSHKEKEKEPEIGSQKADEKPGAEEEEGEPSESDGGEPGDVPPPPA